jgi:tetratricopeptide (TPR) repeat protein
MLCALLLLVISIFVIRFGRKQRYLPVGWFWFLGTLVPVIGLVQVGEQSLADRYTYIPYTGLFIIIAWGLPELLSKWLYRSPRCRDVAAGKIALGIAAAMVLTAMGIGTYRQVGYWKNNSTLFTHAVEVTQNNYIAHNDFGVAYGELGRWQDAIEAYKQAIRIKPNYAEAHYNLGVAYGKLGRYQDAIKAYKQAIRIEPDLAEAHDNLGNIYGKLGRYQDAAEAFKRAIRIKPDFADARYNLGVTYFLTGDKGSALEEYEILKTLDAEQANKLFNLIYK